MILGSVSRLRSLGSQINLGTKNAAHVVALNLPLASIYRRSQAGRKTKNECFSPTICTRTSRQQSAARTDTPVVTKVGAGHSTLFSPLVFVSLLCATYEIALPAQPSLLAHLRVIRKEPPRYRLPNL